MVLFLEEQMNFNYGYACLNTCLRKKKIFSSRTCRISTIKTKGVEYLKELSIKNLEDLLLILQWNVENEIFFMRVSSDLFPFASHPEYSYSLDFADELLKKIGSYARNNGIRLTMHPGQYNVLSSPHPKVIQNTLKDLNHHCEILDRMEMGANSVIIIHGGGVYGNKPKALERLEQNFLLLNEATQKRLVLENCEMSYNVEDLLPISEKLQVPIILDFHHDDIFHSKETIDFYFDRVFKVWNNRGIKPKVHVSNSCPDVKPTDSKTARRKHSDYIYFLHDTLLKIEFPIDVMFEAKMKEQAVLRFRNTI
jgi:UV DNA damage endonuclease